jgi:hypothetical protein
MLERLGLISVLLCFVLVALVCDLFIGRHSRRFTTTVEIFFVVAVMLYGKFMGCYDLRALLLLSVRIILAWEIILNIKARRKKA